MRFLAMLLLTWGVCVMVVSLSLNICALVAEVAYTASVMLIQPPRTDHLVQQPAQGSLHTLGYLGGKVVAEALPLPAAEGGAATTS